MYSITLMNSPTPMRFSIKARQILPVLRSATNQWPWPQRIFCRREALKLVGFSS